MTNYPSLTNQSSHKDRQRYLSFILSQLDGTSDEIQSAIYNIVDYSSLRFKPADTAFKDIVLFANQIEATKYPIRDNSYAMKLLTDLKLEIQDYISDKS
ncbi:MAG: hypothetical protein WCI47_02870 [bacterium]